MIDSTSPQQLLSDQVLAALGEHGFALHHVGGHVLATRDATRVVVPAPGRALPDTFVRRLEHALLPVLGDGWLGAARTADEGPSSAAMGDAFGVQVLDAVVDRCPRSGDWCAFLPSEITVMGCGPTREDALRDLKEATALWAGLPVDRLVLMTPDVL